MEEIQQCDICGRKCDGVHSNKKNNKKKEIQKITNILENSKVKPVLLYIYTNWCKTCVKNLPTINEIAREFQNTELEVLTLAIDRDMTKAQLKNHLQKSIELGINYNDVIDKFLNLIDIDDLESKQDMFYFLRSSNLFYE